MLQKMPLFFSFSFSLQLGSYAQHRSTIYFWFSTVSWILLFTVVSTRNSNSSFFNIKKKTNKTTAVPNKINKFLAEMRSLNSETLPGWLGSFKPTLITIQVSLPKNQHFATKIFWPTVRKKCSSDREKLLNFEAESREFSKFLRSL